MANSIPPLLTIPEVQRLLGRRCKALRLVAHWKRTTLAERSGVSARTLQRFEDTGEVSLKNLLRLAQALERLLEFTELLQPARAQSLAELDARTNKPPAKRGRI